MRHVRYSAAVSRPILFLGAMPFRALRQRPQHLALALSRRAPVLDVEPHRSLLGRLASPDRILEDPPSQGGSLDVLEPPRALPLSGYLRLLNRIGCARTASGIRARLAARAGARASTGAARHDGIPIPGSRRIEKDAIPALWAPRAIVGSFPKQLDLVDRFPGVPVCYDVMDDYPLFFDPWQRRVLSRLHHALLARADAVVVTSAALEARCRAHVRGVLTRIPNGVDRDFLEACARDDPDPAVLALPAPRIGYVGAIERWLDVDVLRAVAEAIPEGSLVLVGPESAPLSSLPANVHRLGPRSHARLPAVLRTLDAGLVPFTRSALTEAVNAVKIYEYLSAGLPVLSADLDRSPELESYLTICRTLEEWRGAARRTAAGRTPSSESSRRRSFAGRNLWDDRAESLLAILRRIEGTEAR